MFPGISTKLTYSSDNFATNFEHLTKEFRDKERPLYIMEEKKVNDIIAALVKVTKNASEDHLKDMTKVFEESVNCTGILSRPILSLMMWGPQSSNNERNQTDNCNLERDSWNQLVLDKKFHDCRSFQGAQHWRYSHADIYSCKKNGNPQMALSGPVITTDLTMVYQLMQHRAVLNQL